MYKLTSVVPIFMLLVVSTSAVSRSDSSNSNKVAGVRYGSCSNPPKCVGQEVTSCQTGTLNGVTLPVPLPTSAAQVTCATGKICYYIKAASKNLGCLDIPVPTDAGAGVTSALPTAALAVYECCKYP